MKKIKYVRSPGTIAHDPSHYYTYDKRLSTMSDYLKDVENPTSSSKITRFDPHKTHHIRVIKKRSLLQSFNERLSSKSSVKLSPSRNTTEFSTLNL